jgi:hypothetical protein
MVCGAVLIVALLATQDWRKTSAAGVVAG